VDSRGWLETARRVNLEQLTASHQAVTASAPGARPTRPSSDIDEDEDQLAAYNAFLARINQGGHEPPS
jgi:hypothetical protein